MSLIPAEPGFVALIENKLDRPYELEIVAWDAEDGVPWVIPLNLPALGLQRCTDIDGYVGFGHSLTYCDKYIAMTGSGGWQVRYPASTQEAGWTEPLVGWGITKDGRVVPLEDPCDDESALPPGIEAEVFHPSRVKLNKLDK